MTKANILIVEDEFITAESLRGHLETLGYSVCAVVASGHSAVEEAERKNPDLVLMDIVLQNEMDGIEAAQLIGGRFGIPIIYLTAYSDESVVERAKVTQPMGYLIKPIVERELQIAIEMALYRHAMERRDQKAELLQVMAGGMAHDLNNLLTPVLLGLSMMQASTPTGSKNARELSLAEQACLDAKDLIQQFILYAAGGGAGRHPTSLLQAIRSTATLVLAGSGCSSALSLPEDLWIVECDEWAIRQALAHLIRNACESMTEGGTVHISARNCVAGEEGAYSARLIASGRAVEICVQDSGAGIPSEHLSRIFSPYFTTKERGSQRGIGLGLSIAHSIVTAHRGFINVESAPGVGSRVCVVLPTAPEGAEARTEAHGLKPTGLTECRQVQGELRLLSSQLLQNQEEERRRIVRELHDSIGSSLSAIKFSLENTLQQMQQGLATPEPIVQLIAITQQTLDEARRIMSDLRPSLLDDLGIVTAIEWFTGQFQTIYSHIRLDKRLQIEDKAIPEPLHIVIFRVVQEALHNAAKHSGAERIELSLTQKDGSIELLIRDHGVGFDASSLLSLEQRSQGLGLVSMRERVEASGGSFSLESTVGEGTTVRALWPAGALRERHGS